MLVKKILISLNEPDKDNIQINFFNFNGDLILESKFINLEIKHVSYKYDIFLSKNNNIVFF